jgi:sigma-B regulation protein RsbU (phosphoserine phosphatase)
MLSILVTYEQKILHYKHEGGPIELGRGPQRELPRVPLFLEDLHTSRDQLRVEELPGGRVRLQNLSKADQHRAGVTITLNNMHQLLPQAVWEGPLPVRAAVGQKTMITLELGGPGPLGSSDSTPSPGALGFPEPPPPVPSLLTIAPPVPRLRAGQTMLLPPSAKQGGAPLTTLTTVNELGESPSLETLARWMETVLALQRSSASPEEFYAQTSRAMVDLIGLDIALVLLVEGKGWRELARAARPELPTERPATREYSHTILGRVVTERRTFYQDVRPLDAQKSGLPANAVVASPILGLQDDVVGALYGLRLWQSPQNDTRGRALGGHPADAKIRPLEAQVLQLLAAAVSANQTRMTATQIERDLEIGRYMQASFLPKGLPQLPGWEIAAEFDPAREVSGDFYDVFRLSGDHLALVIADVCDKGVGAALFMTLFRSLIRAFARQAVERNPFSLPGRPAAATRSRRSTLLADLTALSTIELTNEYVARTHESACMFATLFFGVLDTNTGALSFVNAGHDFPVLLGPAGVKGRLEQTGPAVGVNPDAEYDIQQVRLEPGDSLFAYTDGVTEARSPAGDFFSEKRLLALLESPAPSAAALLEGVIARLDEHVAGREPSDDVTVLAVRRLADEGQPPHCPPSGDIDHD